MVELKIKSNWNDNYISPPNWVNINDQQLSLIDYNYNTFEMNTLSFSYKKYYLQIRG